MVRRLLPLGGALAAFVLALAGLNMLVSAAQTAIITATDPTRPQALAIAATQTAESTRATLTATAQAAAVQAAQTAQYGAWPWVLVALFVGGCAVAGALAIRHEQGLDWAGVEAAAAADRAERELVWIGDVAYPRAALLEDPQISIRAAQILAWQRAQEARALTPAPAHLVYSPSQHYAPSWQQHAERAGALPHVTTLPGPEPAQLAGGGVPTFASLRAQGLLGPGRPLLLGWADGGPLTGSWKDLYSTAIAGISGSGKTTAQRFLIGQAAESGARLALLDPNPGKEGDSLSETLGPLSATFLCAPATEDRAAVQTLRLMDQRLQARLLGQERDRTPLIVVIDEFTHWMGRSTVAPVLAPLIEAIAQMGRGVAVFAMLSGQIWSASRAGGTELRDSLASAYVMRIKTRQARMLINVDEIDNCETLETGECYLWRTSGEVDRLWIPNTTAADIVEVATRIAQATPKPSPSHPQATTAPAAPTADAYVMPSDGLDGYDPASMAAPEEVRVLALFAAGQDPKAIVAAVWGIDADKNPRGYKPKFDQVLALIRAELQRRD